MAGSIKEYGKKELEAFRKRVNRQFTLGRITGGDRDNLIKKIDDIEAYIIKMPEGKHRIKDFY